MFDAETWTGPRQALQQITFTRSLWVGATEITHAHWAALAPKRPAPSFFPPPDPPDGSKGVPYPDVDNLPVDSVSWHDAAWYANALSRVECLSACYVCTGGYGEEDTGRRPTCRLIEEGAGACEGYRLPSSPEWEYAARGGEDYPYAGSAEPTEVGWVAANVTPQFVQPVAQLRPNGFGLYDMTGNLTEWVGHTYPSAVPYRYDAVDPEVGPQAEDQAQRFMKAVSYYGAYAPHDRIAFSHFHGPAREHASVSGFRVVRSHTRGADADGPVPAR